MGRCCSARRRLSGEHIRSGVEGLGFRDAAGVG